MLFNSYIFLFIFFPAVVAAYYAAGPLGETARLVVILVASCVFYAAWDARFLVLLAGSILANYIVGQYLSRAVENKNLPRANFLVGLGVTLNLLTIGVFKYANFFVANLDILSGANFVLGKIVLPLGISFFTFEQISYLVDLRRGSAYHADILRYATFVSFFPRLVAGPILRFSEIGPQLTEASARDRTWENIAVGLTIFFIGLAKKTVLADGIASYVSPVFDLAAAGKPVDFLAAWAGALAYTCQLYFDFSGYSDMAIGAARCFGIRFPMNFNSPYKSANMIEFWRRWHMTLSRFLRDYLYIPLGGNRRGRFRRYVNLMVTMLLGGLWHGANWTFVAWGGLHGLYLAINHAWLELRGGVGAKPTQIGRGFAFLLTFLAVVVAWVFFRSPTFAAAMDLLAGMAGQHGVTFPLGLSPLLGPMRPFLLAVGVAFVNADGAKTAEIWSWILVLLTIAFAAPNTQEIMARYEPVLAGSRTGIEGKAAAVAWRPSIGWAVAIGAVAFVATISITRVSEFLYWQF